MPIVRHLVWISRVADAWWVRGRQRIRETLLKLALLSVIYFSPCAGSAACLSTGAGSNLLSIFRLRLNSRIRAFKAAMAADDLRLRNFPLRAALLFVVLPG